MELSLVLAIGRLNPTYGKSKTTTILIRDKGERIIESKVGRSLKKLNARGLISESISAVREKRKRNFRDSYAKRVKYKAYKAIEMGQRGQIDHMNPQKRSKWSEAFSSVG